MDIPRRCEELIETLAGSLNLAPEDDAELTEKTLREVQDLWKSDWGTEISTSHRLAMLALASELMNSDRVRRGLAGPLAMTLAQQDLPARDSLVAAVLLWSIGKSNEGLEARALAHARTVQVNGESYDPLTRLYARRVVCLFSTDRREILALLENGQRKCGVIENLNLICWASETLPPNRALRLVNDALGIARMIDRPHVCLPFLTRKMFVARKLDGVVFVTRKRLGRQKFRRYERMVSRIMRKTYEERCRLPDSERARAVALCVIGSSHAIRAQFAEARARYREALRLARVMHFSDVEREASGALKDLDDIDG
jgi:hypothetical protein